VKFGFIHAEKAEFPVVALCRVLEVTRQGYYAYVRRKASQRALRDEALRERVKALHAESRGTYGSPRVRHALRDEGLRVGKRRVERTMREMGLFARMRRRFRVTTQADPAHATVSNVLDRRFDANKPNERWVTDITYVWTDEGWCYVAAIIDLFSRAVVGWAVDATLTTRLPLTALEMAVQRRHHGRGLLHHSDRGCQYTSAEYQHALYERGIAVSMSRKGNCWDNAVAESFFATLKAELVHGRAWPSRSELRAALFDYIELFYNRKRLHSTLNYKTPAQAEADYALGHAA
jgi:transposase InsO family protein